MNDGFCKMKFIIISKAFTQKDATVYNAVALIFDNYNFLIDTIEFKGR